MERIRPEGTRFSDEYGRTRIFSGVNLVYKGCEPDSDGTVRYRFPAEESDLAALAARGVDLVRLGLTWAGVEPRPEIWNLPYLEGVRAAVRLCAKYGIRVLLDFHQDLYSAWCYCGDGAPEWACADPALGRKPKLIWAEGYFFNRSVQRSFDLFWNNAPVQGKGLRDRYCDMLAHVAAFLAEEPNLMAVDVLNEPFPGSAGKRVGLRLLRDAASTLLFSKRVDRAAAVKALAKGDIMGALAILEDPCVITKIERRAARLVRDFDLKYYTPFFEAAAAAVHGVLPDVTVVSENCYFSNMGIPCSLIPPPGVKGRFATAPHGYDLTVDTPLTNRADPVRVDYIFAEHLRQQRRLGCPVIVGEWGGMVPGAESYPALEHLIETFDRNGWSQTYWHWFKGMEDSAIMDVLARPRPAAAAGTALRYGYDRRTKTFTLSYAGDPACRAPTRVFLPEEPAAIDCPLPHRVVAEYGAMYLEIDPAPGACRAEVRFR